MDEELLHQINALVVQAGRAYVPFFPLGGFTPLLSSALSGFADWLGANPMQVAVPWLPDS